MGNSSWYPKFKCYDVNGKEIPFRKLKVINYTDTRIDLGRGQLIITSTEKFKKGDYIICKVQTMTEDEYANCGSFIP